MKVRTYSSPNASSGAEFGATHKTIDQILSYLTWRDSKAAIVLFVDNKNLDAVLHKVEEKTMGHCCFVAFHDSPTDGHYNFEFKLAPDEPRSVRIAVLCFHFPGK
jgi:hypothetical protein